MNWDPLEYDVKAPNQCGVAPATVSNFGLTKDWKAVFAGRGKFPFLSSPDRANLTDVAALLKGVLRPGSPSIATEFAVFLPGINAQPWFGASLAGIVSQLWEWGAVHLNLATALTRNQHAIVEGPNKWPVRPVVEVFYEDEIGQPCTISALGGTIWQVKDDLNFDVGLRRALATRTLKRTPPAGHRA